MTTKTAKVNYTEEMVAKLHDMYAELGNDGIDTIAKALSKPVRSIRAKLVRDGLYVAPEKGADAKKEGPSKKDIIREIEEIGFDCKGLEGATKDALNRVKDLVTHATAAN